MNWREQRKKDIEQTISNKMKILNEYEQNLTCEDDPKSKRKIQDSIESLKQQIDDLDLDHSTYDVSVPSDTHTKNLAVTMAEINDEDMRFVIKALLEQRIPESEQDASFRLTAPQEKMKKNGLTSESRWSLDIGLAKAGEVRHLIEKTVKVSFPNVPEKLKAVLNAEYVRLTELGVRGDELFNCLHDFLSCNSSDFKRKTAALAVLCYFFESCDVFEP